MIKLVTSLHFRIEKTCLQPIVSVIYYSINKTHFSQQTKLFQPHALFYKQKQTTNVIVIYIHTEISYDNGNIYNVNTNE